MKLVKTKILILGLMLFAACFFYPTVSVNAAQTTKNAESEDTSSSATLSSTTWKKKNGVYTKYKSGKKTYEITSKGVVKKNGEKVSLKKYKNKIYKIGNRYFYVGKNKKVDKKAGWKKDANGDYAYYVATNGTVTVKVTSAYYKYKSGKLKTQTLSRNSIVKIKGKYFYADASGKIVKTAGWYEIDDENRCFVGKLGNVTYQYKYENGAGALYEVSSGTAKKIVTDKSVGNITFVIAAGEVSSYVITGTVYQPSGQKEHVAGEKTTETATGTTEVTTEVITIAPTTTEATTKIITIAPNTKKETTEDTTEDTTEATTEDTEEATTECTEHWFYTDYTIHNAAGEEHKVDETDAVTHTETETYLKTPAHDITDLRYFCGECWSFERIDDEDSDGDKTDDLNDFINELLEEYNEKGIDYIDESYFILSETWCLIYPDYAEMLKEGWTSGQGGPYTWDELVEHCTSLRENGIFHGSWFGDYIVVGRAEDEYATQDVTVVDEDAYDTYYLTYTCANCGETMTGTVVRTYDGEKPDGYEGVRCYNSSTSSVTITFNKTGKLVYRDFYTSFPSVSYIDCTNDDLGVDVIETDKEYDVYSWGV